MTSDTSENTIFVRFYFTVSSNQARVGSSQLVREDVAPGKQNGGLLTRKKGFTLDLAYFERYFNL